MVDADGDAKKREMNKRERGARPPGARSFSANGK